MTIKNCKNGSFTTSAISKKTTHLVAFPFVDDTDLPCTDFRTENISDESIMTAMQTSIDRWEGGLKSSGGAIVPHKSWVYPISFKFDDTGLWEYKSIEEIGSTFTVRDQFDNLTELD